MHSQMNSFRDWEQVSNLADEVLERLNRRYGNRPDCEDAVQEALLTWKAIREKGEVIENPSAWLNRVARNKLFDWDKRRAKVRPIDKIDLEAFASEGFDKEILSIDLAIDHPYTPLDILEQQDQEDLDLIAYLYWEKGLTFQEIAQHLNVSVATAWRRLEAARKILQETYADYLPASLAL